jgi:hypothetical protein
VGLITNQATTQPERYPVTVVYHDVQGHIWSRPLADWHASMTALPAPPPPTAAEINAAIDRELKLAERGAYKFPRPGVWTVRHLKEGNRHLGWFLTMPGKPGVKPSNMYFARRTPSEKSQKFNAWTIESAALSVLRQHCCRFVGIYVSDGTMMLAPIEVFRVDETKGVRLLDRRASGRGLQLAVPETLFRVWAPPQDEAVATVMAGMHIPNSRTTKPKPRVET